MNFSKLRRAIAHEAARLMYFRQESEYYQAKNKAARQLCKGWVKPTDLPTNTEIREAVQSFARLLEGDSRLDSLRDMRLTALRVMRLLSKFHPRLIGSVYTGHVRTGSDIDIHIFSDSIEVVLGCLDDEGLPYEVERKQVRKNGENATYTHVHIREAFDVELTIYRENLRSYGFKSSITGKKIEGATLPQLEEFLAEAYPNIQWEQELASMELQGDPYRVFYSLLVPLENVKQHPKYHPEGDVLYHSLQVYDLACDAIPYDEEFLLAALLHDVGKGIDPKNHVEAGLEALDGFITERTAWLIAHHMDTHKIVDGSIGARAHRRLRENESYDELILLGKCDRGGRVSGIETTALEDALSYLQTLSE
ncbi:MAG: HD domain-containing protein [Planctomycetes bacterium]|nr:HD domain-containing protein [Planctomycetota bacterium]